MLFNNRGVIPSLYLNGRFQPQLAKEMGRRFANVPNELIAETQAILKANVEDKSQVPDWQWRLTAVWAIVQVRSFWAGGEYVSAQREAVLSRLESIPPAAILAWKMYESESGADTAVHLLNVPELFQGNRFNLALLEKVLPIALKKFPTDSVQ